MLGKKRDGNNQRSADDLMNSYTQYFTAQPNAVRGQQDATSFAIYSAYDDSIPVSYSDSSVPLVNRQHA